MALCEAPQCCRLPCVSFTGADRTTMYSSSHHSSLAITIIFPCPAVPPPPSPLWACCGHPGSLDPVPQVQRIPAHDRGVSNVISCPIRVKCMHETPAVARQPGKNAAKAELLACCRQTSPCCYIICALPIQTSLSFFLKSAPGSKLDKSSISTTTTTLDDNIG